ncbi:MAG: hypothetical protein WDA03_00160 [Trueperaceae bacterium]
MARIVLGNREGSFAIRQGRHVLERLTDEWPDLHLTLRTVSGTSGESAEPLLAALEGGQVGMALVQLESLPYQLPEGLTLVAVTRRGEARSALAARGRAGLAELAAGTQVAVPSQRDAAFLAAAHGGLEATVVADHTEALVGRLARGEFGALVVPALALTTLDHKNAIDAVLEEAEFTPAPGQGALGLLARADDDVAFEAAYSLQHRPSFDRVRAERAFAAALTGHTVGALASVTDDGELTLFGAVVQGGMTLQASTTGEAREAEDLGRELAQDVLAQLAAL